MNSRIEQLIGEIEEYIDSCKYQPLSNTKILVNKEEMEELLVELRLRVPEEIKKYQKIISQQEAILQDAKAQAASMLENAKTQTDEMVSESEIMQQAYARANELVQQAQAQAERIVNNAVDDANNIRGNAIQYTDEMLASLETILGHNMNEAQRYFNGVISSFQDSYKIVSNNRAELSKSFVRPEEENREEQPAAAQDENPETAEEQ